MGGREKQMVSKHASRQASEHCWHENGWGSHGRRTLRAQAVVAPLSRPAASSPIRRSCSTFVGRAVAPSMKRAASRGWNSRGMARPAAGVGGGVGCE